MQSRIIDGPLLELSKSVHHAVHKEEAFGWVEGKWCLTIEEAQSLYLLLPSYIEEMKVHKESEKRKKREELELKLKELEND